MRVAPEGGHKKGGPRQVPRSPPLKHTTAYNENNYYAVTWIVHLESFMYLRRRQWLRHMVAVCHIACWFRSGAVLKFGQFYHSNFL